MNGAAIALLMFGAANAVLSRYAGTCTQGSADQLGGLWLVLFSYALALVLVWRGRPGLPVLGVGAALLPVVLWHAAEGLRFAWGVFVRGQSACSLLVMPPFRHDGRETLFALLWLAASIGLPALLWWRLWRSWRTKA